MKPSLDVIQAAQSTLLQLQCCYRDNQLEFWALGIAWEAARFAWYVVSGDRGSAAAKLVRLQDMIADFERLLDKQQKNQEMSQ